MTAKLPVAEMKARKAARHRRFRARVKGTVKRCTMCGKDYVITSDPSLCRDCRRAYSRAWNKAHADSELARARKYRKENRAAQADRSRKCMARLRATDPDYYKRLRVWRSENKDKVREMDARKRAKRHRGSAGDFTVRDWRQLKIIWGNRCAYCGKESHRLTRDHMTPLVRGGEHVVSNIVPACSFCNGQKNNKTVEEYYQWLETNPTSMGQSWQKSRAARIASLDKTAA